MFAGALVAGLALVASMLLIAGPLGDLVFPAGGFRFFPSVLDIVHRKPGEQMRYVLAVAFVLGLAVAVARARPSGVFANTQAGRVGVRLAAMAGRLAIVGVAVWGWQAQFHNLAGEPATTHFGDGDLIVAVLVAGALVLFARLRPGWLGPRALSAQHRARWVCLALAALLTACWLLPSFFLQRNLGAASLSVTYHLQFTFDDFVAVYNGRTPLVNYAEQYASLLPFVVWLVFHVGGPHIGTFISTMCLLSLAGLLAVQRALAIVTRSERLALAMYVPFLATSLFFILRGGSELFSWGSYYATFPMRYVGPYVLLWLCVRHMRGMRPRSLVVVFAFAGLVLLNNIEFGLPAFAAAAAAVTAGSAPGPGRVTRLIKLATLGLASALAAVSALTLLLAGQLPNLSLLTLYSRMFADGGYGLLPTPVAGLHLIVYMTFAGAVLVSAVRYRRDAGDRAYTGALAYSGVFGLGAGGYYMGRTTPGALVALFSIWALSVVLLALLSLRTVAAWRDRPGAGAPSLLLLAGTLLSLGLTTTAVAQFPAPWTQLRRIAASSPPPAQYNVSAAVAFVRRTAAPGEHIVLLAPLGHLIAADAGVENVSPYSHPEGVVTYQQLDELLKALHDASGTRFYVGSSVFPEITRTLTSKGFSPTVDVASGVTEWRRGVATG